MATSLLVFHLNNEESERCVANVGRFVPLHHRTHRIGSRIPLDDSGASSIKDLILSARENVRKCGRVLMAEMHCAWRERTPQDSDVIVFMQLLTWLLSLSFHGKRIGFFASCRRARDDCEGHDDVAEDFSRLHRWSSQ
jgi:hypothetical protein